MPRQSSLCQKASPLVGTRVSCSNCTMNTVVQAVAAVISAQFNRLPIWLHWFLTLAFSLGSGSVTLNKYHRTNTSKKRHRARSNGVLVVLRLETRISLVSLTKESCSTLTNNTASQAPVPTLQDAFLMLLDFSHFGLFI